MTFSDGQVFPYAYDQADRFSSAGPSAGSVTAAYDTLSRVNGLTRGASVSTSTLAHDFADRMSGLTHAFTPTSGNETWAFAYTDAGQLATSTGSRANWDWQATPAAPVATAPNGLNQNATVGAASWTYDKNGNLTSDGTRTFTYDPENRLISESGPVGLTLAYDPTGRLQQSVVNGATTDFLYDGQDLAAEYDGSGNILRRYVHGPDADDPLVWFEGANLATPHYLIADRQGSIVAVANGAGALTANYTYDPYGVPNTWGTVGTVPRFRYTGQIAIPEAQLYYYKARIYDPGSGKFLQTDPVGYGPDLNWYAYVANDPVNHTDPAGTDALWVTNPDGTTTLVIPVQYTGQGATPENVAAIVGRANSLTIEGGGTNIQVVPTNRPIGGILNRMDFSPGYNTKMCGGAGECVNRLGGNRAHINSDNPQATDAGAHDTLHFAGIKDQYQEGPRDAQGNRTSTPTPGYTNRNIMTSRSGTTITSGQVQEAKTNPTTKQCTVVTGSRIPVC